MPPTPISILLAEDHLLFRQDIRRLLEAQSDVRIVGEVATGREAITSALRLCPNIVVLDLMMPGLGGIEVLNRLQQQCPEMRIVILSMHAEEVYVNTALLHGASGYVVKEDAFSHLVPAVRAVVAGRQYLSPQLRPPS